MRVIVGASLIALMVMSIEALLVKAPPLPELPRSLRLMSSVPLPLKFDVGMKLSPASAALMSASVPVNVIVASVAPSPAVNVRPVVEPRVSVPFVAVSESSRSLVPESMSAMLIALLLPLLKTSVTSSSVV